MRTAIVFCIVFLLSPVLLKAGPIEVKFSIDPASPAIDGSITPDDVLVAGPGIHTPGTLLGLQDDFFNGLFDNLDALSYGVDVIRNPLFFSVDRVAVGVPGTAVFTQAQPGAEEAAGDVYRALPPFARNRLVIDEEEFGLTPGFFGDDIDALEMNSDRRPATFFSIDLLSATGGGFADDILGSSGSGTFSIFCEGVSEIGLTPGDDLDALALDAVSRTALFSLSAFSPSTFTGSGNAYIPGVKGFLSPADVLITRCDGSFSLWAPAASLGLRPDDELDALDTVPEPGTLILMSSGLLSLLVRRRRGKEGPDGLTLE